MPLLLLKRAHFHGMEEDLGFCFCNHQFHNLLAMGCLDRTRMIGWLVFAGGSPAWVFLRCYYSVYSLISWSPLCNSCMNTLYICRFIWCQIQWFCRIEESNGDYTISSYIII